MANLIFNSQVGNTLPMSYGSVSKAYPTDADYTSLVTEYVNRHITMTGTMTTTKKLIMPITAGAEHVFTNSVSVGAMNVIGATGTGFTVANARTAIGRCDGTNWIRVTADSVLT